MAVYMCLNKRFQLLTFGKEIEMENLKTFVQNEISGWKKWEVAWMVLACAVIAGLSVYWGDSTMGIISATTGVACVVCTGKGKLSAYLFGLVNSVLYAIIAYHATYYGETMLNAIYYVPMQFVGFYVWSKHMNTETKEVIKRNMKITGRLLLVASIAVATFVYGIILKNMGDAMPFVDAFTTVSSVVAMIISVKMFTEQWWIWVAVDILSVYMWWCNFSNGSDNLATLLMWVIYLGNAIIMLVKWTRDSKKIVEV